MRRRMRAMLSGVLAVHVRRLLTACAVCVCACVCACVRVRACVRACVLRACE